MSESTANATIIFIPGVKPKPEKSLHRRELLRCLLGGLSRSRPPAAELLQAHPEIFDLLPWSFGAYGVHRDIARDLPGIEQLLAAPQPSDADIAEIRRLARRTNRLTHKIGDRFPALGRLFAAGGVRESLSDARGYLRDLHGLATAIRSALKLMISEAAADSRRVILIGHSLGSVIAYDACWELSHESDTTPPVDTFVSLGSPLTTRFVSELLKGVDRYGRERYPTNIAHWYNFAALGETVAFFPPVSKHYREMLQLGLIKTLADRLDLYNHFRGERGLNVHVSYGFLAHPVVAAAIGDALLRSRPKNGVAPAQRTG